MHHPTVTENRSMYDPIALTEFLMRIADFNSHEAKNRITNRADPTAISSKTVYFGMQYGFDLSEDDDIPEPEIAKAVVTTSWIVKIEITTDSGSVHIEYIYDPASQERRASIRHTDIKQYRAGLPGPVTDEDIIGHVLHRLVFDGEWGKDNWTDTRIEDLRYNMREVDYWRAIDEADRAPTAAEEAVLYDKAARIASDISQKMAQEAIEARKAAAECRSRK